MYKNNINKYIYVKNRKNDTKMPEKRYSTIEKIMLYFKTLIVSTEEKMNAYKAIYPQIFYNYFIAINKFIKVKC